MLDNGSERSYLTQSARDALCMQPIDRRRLAIAAFGSKRADLQLCELVSVNICIRDGQYTSVNLFVVPHICEPLANQQLIRCMELF